MIKVSMIWKFTLMELWLMIRAFLQLMWFKTKKNLNQQFWKRDVLKSPNYTLQITLNAIKQTLNAF